MDISKILIIASMPLNIIAMFLLGIQEGQRLSKKRKKGEKDEYKRN